MYKLSRLLLTFKNMLLSGLMIHILVKLPDWEFSGSLFVAYITLLFVLFMLFLTSFDTAVFTCYFEYRRTNKYE